MHGLVTLFLEVIALTIILLLVGLFVLVVLVFATRVIVVSIVLMTIIILLIVTIVPVALVVVMILATMLLVAQITAASNGKMGHLLFFLLFHLLDLLKDTSHFIGSLMLLEKDNKPKWVRRQHLVHLRKLVLMCLGLREEDLFVLLLCCGQLHHSMDVATVKVAEKLYSMLHELMHWHVGRLLGGAKPEN